MRAGAEGRVSGNGAPRAAARETFPGQMPQEDEMKISMMVARTAAIAAGREVWGWQDVELPLAECSDAERVVLAATDRLDAEHGVDTHGRISQGSYPRYPLTAISEATPATAHARLAELIALPGSRTQEIEDVISMVLAAAPEKWIILSDGQPYHSTTPHVADIHPEILRAAMADPRVQARRADMDALWLPQIAVADAAKAQRAAAEKSALQAEAGAKIARLRDWAEAHGSDLLRARIADQYEWQSLARREYADMVIAAIAVDLPPADDPSAQDGWTASNSDRDRPTLAEIEAVRDVRKRAADAGCPVAVSLRWMTYSPGDDDADEAGERIQRTEILIEIETPDGQSVSQYRMCPKSVV